MELYKTFFCLISALYMGSLNIDAGIGIWITIHTLLCLIGAVGSMSVAQSEGREFVPHTGHMFLKSDVNTAG